MGVWPTRRLKMSTCVQWRCYSVLRCIYYGFHFRVIKPSSMSFRSRNFITRIDLNKTPHHRGRHELMFFIIFVLYSLVHMKNDEKNIMQFFSFHAEHTTLRLCGRIIYIITRTADVIRTIF